MVSPYLGECLSGDRHRELPCPEPEGPEYEACYQWSEETCCTAEFTEQLAGATVLNIDGFHWSRCDPPLSEQCEDYFQRVECFYRYVANFFLVIINFMTMALYNYVSLTSLST